MNKALATAALLAATALPAAAQETLKMHHFVPPKAPPSSRFMMPWAEKVEKASGGKIKIQLFPTMSLGGTPPQLVDQVRDGVVDLTFTPGRETSKEEVNAILKAASEKGPLAGILDYTDEPLVSIDLNHNAASSTVDSLETAVIEGKLVRVVSWYDNEWGFSNRMVDTAGAIAKLI